MVRKMPAVKKRTPTPDSFFDPPLPTPPAAAADHKPVTGSGSSSAEVRVQKLERQLVLLRQEYSRLCEENERLKDAASLVPYGYCELDRRGLILEANGAFAHMVQSDVRALQGTAMVNFFPERLHQKFLSFLHHAFHSAISHTIDLPIVPIVDEEFYIRMDCRCADRVSGQVLCCVIIAGAAPTRRLTTSEASLLQEEEHFRTIADYSTDWKMWIGLDGRLVWVNSAVELLTGHTPTECYSIPDFPYPLIAESDRETIAGLFSDALGGVEEEGVEFRFLKKDSSEQWGAIRCHPMYDKSGQLLGFCATIKNVGPHKELEEELAHMRRGVDRAVRERTSALQHKNAALSEELVLLQSALELSARREAGKARRDDETPADAPSALPGLSVVVGYGVPVSDAQKKSIRFSKQFLEQVIDAIGDPVFVKNKESRYILVSNSFIEFTGFGRKEIIGKCDHEIFKPEEAAACLISDNAVFEKQTELVTEELFTRYDGQPRRLLVKKSSYFDEHGSQFIVGVLRDVTELRNAEDEMRAAFEKEKELNELKSRFVTMVSHEYKTPLTAILSSAELLELFRKSWDDKKVELHLQKIKRAVETMTEMLSDALFLNKIETGRMQIALNTFELVSFCIMTADEVQSTASHQNIIETSSSVTHAMICTDNKLLRYILTNILSNAMKYSFPKTSIQFETVLAETSVTFRVRNCGIGIPPETYDNLFEPFFRAPNTGSIPGTGLGLSIVKRCVDSLQGTISFESIPNKVTTFTATIPVQVIEYQMGIARAATNHDPVS
ncbi:MAG TPA: PAS domain S-box protein [Bacteroidota bacterium]|nr:PAS domain S-box protein [Bacteroidota bacterium]